MKRYRVQSVLAVLLGALIALPLALPGASQAQSANPTPTPAPTEAPVAPTATVVAPLKSGDANFFSFDTLGQGEVPLRGPIDRANISFATPPAWAVGEGAKLQLDMGVFVSGYGSAPSSSFGGLLTVRLNSTRIALIQVDAVGDRVETIAIPAGLIGSRPDGRNDLTFDLDMGFSCDLNLQANLVLRAGSGLLLPHTVGALPVDLAQLPRPIYQRAIEVAPALLVVPDAPSAEELQAALTTAAAFGRITNGQLALGLVAAGALTAEQRAASHLIFVGKPDSFADLASAKLPAPLGQATLNISGAGADDGVIQLVASPWNAERALLSVSGVSPAGLIKAAQAISNDAVRSYVQPNLALVSAVRAATPTASAANDRTLADLGYAVRTINDRGSQTVEMAFEVPPGQLPNGESYIDLSYSHSALMDYQRSGATVLLNDIPVGAIQFEKASNSLRTERITLPNSLVRSGTNRLTVVSDMNHYVGCTDRNLPELWLSIWPESLLHMPLGDASALPLPTTLASFPSAFIAQPDLSSTLFVVGKADAAGWASAAQIAFELGRRSDGAVASLGATYADALTEEQRAASNLILVGRATQLPLIAELGAQLPAPFAAGSDYADERALQVQYRVAPGASVGYLQAITSPWNAQRVLLGVQGSDDAGLALASTALVTPGNRSRLLVPLVIVDATQLIGATPPVSEIAPTPAPADQGAVVVGRGLPGWIIPGIIAAIVLMGVVLVAALIGRMRRSAPKP